MLRVLNAPASARWDQQVFSPLPFADPVQYSHILSDRESTRMVLLVAPSTVWKKHPLRCWTCKVDASACEFAHNPGALLRTHIMAHCAFNIQHILRCGMLRKHCRRARACMCVDVRAWISGFTLTSAYILPEKIFPLILLKSGNSVD